MLPAGACIVGQHACRNLSMCNCAVLPVHTRQANGVTDHWSQESLGYSCPSAGTLPPSHCQGAYVNVSLQYGAGVFDWICGNAGGFERMQIGLRCKCPWIHISAHQLCHT